MTATDESPEAVREAFEEVRKGVALLLADLSRQPSSLRVQAADIVVELVWQEPAEIVTRQAPAPATEPPAEGLHYVRAPSVGVFYQAPEPGAAPFVAVGTVVAPGEQVAIIEAMKLFLPVESDLSGRVTAVLVHDGASVEFGEPLIALEPAGP
jgi:acetyl-CoA carboxylase biotin carboxyl carrier protein